MNNPPFSIRPLDTSIHDRNDFDSGVHELNRYLRYQVSQDIKRRVTACFVAVNDDLRITGYYTLSTASIPLNDLPEKIKHKLPRYDSVPAIRMGRLAVDKAFQGKGLGGALLVNSLKRAIKLEIPAALFFVDAKDNNAVSFYEKFGFIPLIDRRLSLFIPLSTIGKLMN